MFIVVKYFTLIVCYYKIFNLKCCNDTEKNGRPKLIQNLRIPYSESIIQKLSKTFV